ncbi:phospholipid-transporting ATPase ABCA1-like isoform X2 [Mercenaria mercenaria]|uniref:phospholipid-transporting ATPase ABCA1-like isoform X2 n=1 Tax=Mercenaria mercenaria TaxID=6596 RepID=UPI00234F1E53|nr:phospholipid-transporting ATPase ABCA1-like isoform X2 [Mercenaria mercenaria]XP_045158187.2 phospholipid-transporting ATPase ABCA1-like isoform X2 [Mercenaria mercenaria]
MGFFNQLLLLLWKNFTLRKRQKLRLVAEVVFPLALFLILLIVRITKPDLKVKHGECHFDGKAMPSAGVLPFLQSFMCTFNNTCHKTENADEMPGVAGTFTQTGLAEAVTALEEILNNNVDSEIIADSLTDLNILADLYQKIVDGTAVGNFTLGNSVIDPAKIRQQIIDQNLNLTSDVVDWLLNATLNRQLFVNGLNETSLINIVASLVPPTFVSENDTISYIRQEVCNETRLKEIFYFPNQTMSDRVHDELCGLSPDQFYTLVDDFVQDFDPVAFEQEIQQFVMQNTDGQQLALTLLEQWELLQTLQSNTSWQKPFRDLMNAVQSFQSEGNLPTDVSTASFSRIAGQFICGRSGALLSIDEDQAESLTEADREPVNSDLPSQHSPTPAPFSGDSANQTGQQDQATKDPVFDRLKDRSCVRETTPQCQALFKSLSNSGSETRFLWRQLKPFVRGCVLYYPQNPVTDEIINNTQQFFRDLENIGNLADAWADYSPQLFDYLNNSRTINALRLVVDSSLCSLGSTYAESQLSPNSTFNTSAVCSFLKQYLSNGPNTTQYDWRDSLRYTDQLFSYIGEYIKCFNFDKFVGYTNRQQMMDDGIAMIENDLFWAAVEFTGMDTSTSKMPTNIEYKIRMDVDKVDSTKRIRDRYPKPGPRRQPWHLKYFMYGFAYIQDMLEHAVIKIQTGISITSDVGIVAQQFPYPCYTEDKFIYAISRMLPLFMILAWILTTAMLCKSIVYEKDRRLKEVMKIMGLGNGVHWMAWFINAFIMMFATILILVIVLKAGKVLEHSDPSAVLFFMTIFAIVTIIKCFLISVFFSRPNMAACCAGFIYFLGYLPYMLMLQFDEVLTRRTKMAVGLSSNVAFGYGCNFIALWEEQAIGLQWSNIGISPINDDDFNMLHSIAMMIIDAVIYALFTWYIEAVFPGQYGIPKPFYFPFTKSYWCGSGGQLDGNDLRSTSMELNGQGTEKMEAEPKNKRVGVAIRNLKKKYSSSNRLAVDGLSLNFYEDQITSFLGHNGAGKTTTMSILTGLFPPTAGTAFIHGKDIRTEMDHIRHSLGTCPQHNVLFDWLTVEEHLWFYARLKGSPAKEVKAEMEQMIKDVGLPHKRNEHSSNLSGGMKRKLSVAIAFVGNSKTVILDEPTAGVDPYARRAIWQLLLKLKKGRTIILSTHHMDEADVLGDRIAIISQGRLCCIGSSLFLKNHYGNGYYLTLVRGDTDLDEEAILKEQLMMNSNRPLSAGSVRTVTSVLPSITNEIEDEGYADGKSDSSDPPTPPNDDTTYPGFSVKKVTSFIKKYVPEACLVEDNMTELCYQMPTEAAHRGDFERLFQQLEFSHSELGVSSFGISDTSLEEVFLKVAEENTVEVEEELKRNKLDEMADGGRIPRGVSRLSFKRKKKLSLLGRRSANRVDSKTDLMAEEDTVLKRLLAGDSVISGPVSDYGENGFSHNLHEKVTGWRLTMRQFIAIFFKRFHHVRRSKKGFLTEIVLPVIFILLAMTFSLIAPPFSEEPPLELHPWHYEPVRGDSHLHMFYSNDAYNNPVSEKMEDIIQTKPGVGNRCVNKHSIAGHPCEPVGQQIFPQQAPWNQTRNCDCSTGWQVCPDNAAGPTPPKVLLPTTDYLYNMTGRQISDYLIKTQKEFAKRRYGGLSFGERDYAAFTANISQVQDYLERILKAANNGTTVSLGDREFWYDLTEVLPSLAVKDVAKVWFNNRGWAASVSYINVMNNLILRSNLPSGTNPADYSIVAINHPMEMTKEQLNDEALYSSFKDVVIAICVIFAMSFIPASFTMYLIEERTSNSKHLQFVSGVNPIIYWVSNFCWDMINYLIPTVLCIFIFLAFNTKAYVSATNAPCLVALLCLYGWAMIPLMYPFSRVFSVPSTALVSLKSVNIFLGTVSTLATFIIEFLEEDDEGLKDINNILKQVFLLLPQYCLGRGLFDMAKNQLFADVYARFGENMLPSPFEWKIVGRNLFSMFMLGILFFIINLLIEYKFFIRSRVLKPSKETVDDEDDDVARERKRVISGNAKDDVLRLEELSKVYSSRGQRGRLTAVDRLCVGVPKGQCFGLLGVNGAGKTTTFKMLTGDERLSRGNAYVNNYSILNEMVQVRQNIGYCPQFDALDPLLTGVEHLRFYARLRGIPESDVREVADWAIRRLGLLPHANKISTNYSGGNKRKLSTAISLIGNPSVIFLDEPTTGMDPGARRFLWDCINNIVKDGRSVILTSHSMEECEALCGRLAIMVNGRFRCLGSIQHLKNRFGDGYTVIIRVSGEEPEMDPVMDFFNSEFPKSVLKEKHHNMLQYQLGSDIQLSVLFGQIEAVRDKLNIEDYSVSQTTLDQVFINFAKLQSDLADDEIDEMPEDLGLIGTARTLPSEAEGQSLAGSTAGLIRNEYRHSNHSYRPPGAGDDESLHLTNIREPFQSRPIRSQDHSQNAPIISLPYQVKGQESSKDYDSQSEVSVASLQRRGRPITRFDDDPSNTIPNPEV